MKISIKVIWEREFEQQPQKGFGKRQKIFADKTIQHRKNINQRKKMLRFVTVHHRTIRQTSN